jgi:LPS sulfotransferase NodH
LLWETGCLGAPLEYLNFEAGPYVFAHDMPPLQEQLWRSVQRRRATPNGVFGFKAFPMQLEALQEVNPGLLQAVMAAVMAGAPPKIVYLQRRDRVAHAVSYARATLSGVWRAEQEAGQSEQPEYSQADLVGAERMIELHQGAWEEMFRDLRLTPLSLWYEDVVADPAGAVGQVAKYLGVKLDPAAAIDVPKVRKQDESESLRWAAKYAEGRRG